MEIFLSKIIKIIKSNYIYILVILLCCILFTIYIYNKKKIIENLVNKKKVDIDCTQVLIPSIKIKTKTKYTAIIIEPRKHKALEFVLTNFTENLSKDWNFIIYHGNLNKDFVKNIINNFSINVKSRIKSIQLNIDNITVAEYSTIFFCPIFYTNIPTDIFLIFQTDSMILKENKEKINEFLEYDYVGAPWALKMGTLGQMGVGNGGLSLRNKKKMQELLKYKQKVVFPNVYGKYIAEDQFFNGYYFPQVEIVKPSISQAMNFSVETIYAEKPFGIHKCWMWLNKNELNNLFLKYPDIKILAQLQN
jgi:hypothetical protein